MALENDLRLIGLKKSEIAVYLYLLAQHHASPPQIAKGTGILRTNCYHVLQSLKEQALIREENGKAGRKLYFANDPESLLRSVQEKARSVERLLPDIRARFATTSNKPTVFFYDGLDAIKDIYRKSLEAQEIFALGSTARLGELMPDFLAWYFSQITKHHVVLHDIVTSASAKKGLGAIKNTLATYSPTILPEKYGEMPTDILVWNNHVALITLEEPYFGTVLTNPALANTFTTICRIIAESA